MKNNKIIIMLFVLFSSTIFFVSCSNDDEQITNEVSNKKVDTFLKSFYSNDFKLGRTSMIENKNFQNSSLQLRTAIKDDLNITEVFVENQIKARGYVITDKNTSEFLYFIDVDRNVHNLTSLNVKVNEQKTFSAIKNLSSYVGTNEFDFFEIAINEDDNSYETFGRFWGGAYEQGPCGEAGEGMAYVYRNYYVFGIRVSHVQQVSIHDNQTPLAEPCGFR